MYKFEFIRILVFAGHKAVALIKTESMPVMKFHVLCIPTINNKKQPSINYV